MIKIDYIEEENIVSIYKEGEIDLNGAMGILDSLHQRFGQLDCVYILEDSRKTRYRFKFNDLTKLLQHVKLKLNGRKEVRHADIVSSPLETALSLVYSKLASNIKSYRYKAFSTPEAALEWLKKGYHYNQSLNQQ